MINLPQVFTKIQQSFCLRENVTEVTLFQNNTFFFYFIEALKMKLRKKAHLVKKSVKICFCFGLWKASWEGESRAGIDYYLLDNRNRTQKWDE